MTLIVIGLGLVMSILIVGVIDLVSMLQKQQERLVARVTVLQETQQNLQSAIEKIEQELTSHDHYSH